MFTRDGVLDLHRRAHHSYSQMLAQVGLLPESELIHELDGFGWKDLRDTLVHIIEAEEFWINVLRRNVHRDWEFHTFNALADIERAYDRVAADTRGFIELFKDADIARRVTLHLPDGKVDSTIGHVIAHVITHGFHHKGQVAAMCRLLGQTMNDTDLQIGVR